MRGRPNDRLAMTVTTLVIGIALIGAIQVTRWNYDLLSTALTRPDMQPLIRRSTPIEEVKFRDKAHREEFMRERQTREERYIESIQGPAMSLWKKSAPFSLVAYMFCGLFAAAGVWIGRVIRGKKPSMSTWRESR